MDVVILAQLSPAQLTMRRNLRTSKLKRERQRRRAEQAAATGGLPGFRQCTGSNFINGKQCRMPAIEGMDTCMKHAPKEFRNEFAPGAGISSAGKRKAPEVIREVVEVAAAAVVKPYFDSLGIVFEGYDTETGEPVVTYTGGGLMLHGESKDGDIIMTDYENLLARVQVAERLLDRVYGKPRQTTVLEGGVAPIRVQPVRTEERAQQVAALLSHAGALPPAQKPHEGRRRAKPSGKADVVDSTETAAQEPADG